MHYDHVLAFKKDIEPVVHLLVICGQQCSQNQIVLMEKIKPPKCLLKVFEYLLGIRKHTKCVQQSCFFLALFSCNFDDQLSPNFHRFLMLCILLWDVRTLVFDNNQKLCQVPLNEDGERSAE